MMRQVLFTSSFNGSLKRVLEFILLIGCMVFGIKALNYLYHEPDYAARIMWKSFYAQEDIDTVFLGSSHVYCDIDVKIVDELTGGNSFDMATGSQRIQESYYNLLEAERNYDIKNVYVELYYMVSTSTGGDYSDVSAIKNSWRNTDYMQNGFCRLQGIWNMNDTEHFMDAVMPFVRYRAYLFDWNYISSKISVKSSENYKNYRDLYYPENGFYGYSLEQKGFRYSPKIMDEPTCTQSRTAESMGITDDAEKYLRKIIAYCQKKEIALTLFISPIYETQLISTERYDVYLNSVRAIAEEYRMPVYDFNLIKREYLMLETDDFYDIGHLNSKGAKKFTRCLFYILGSEDKNAGSDFEIREVNPTIERGSFFYNSFSEKMENEIPRLYGAYWINNGDGRVMKIAASDNADMEFEVVLERIGEEGREYETPARTVLQNFDKNRELAVPEDEHGTVVISWRMKGEREVIDTIELEY